MLIREDDGTVDFENTAETDEIEEKQYQNRLRLFEEEQKSECSGNTTNNSDLIPTTTPSKSSPILTDTIKYELFGMIQKKNESLDCLSSQTNPTWIDNKESNLTEKVVIPLRLIDECIYQIDLISHIGRTCGADSDTITRSILLMGSYISAISDFTDQRTKDIKRYIKEQYYLQS